MYTHVRCCKICTTQNECMDRELKGALERVVREKASIKPVTGHCVPILLLLFPFLLNMNHKQATKEI